MDIFAVAWRQCQACGSQTDQRNGCWYQETCRTCGTRLAAACWDGSQPIKNGGKAQKGKSKGEGKGMKGKGQGEHTAVVQRLKSSNCFSECCKQVIKRTVCVKWCAAQVAD